MLRVTAVLLLFFLGTVKSQALELMFLTWPDTYYADCQITLKSPSSAQGLVYVDMSSLEKGTKNPTYQSSPGSTAQLKANLSSSSGYQAYLLAYPRDGYVLDGFVTEDYYNAGNRSSTYFIKDNDKVCKSGSYVKLMPVDTLRDVKTVNPINSSSYSFSAKAFSNLYAVFRSAKSETVTVSAPGQLQAAIESTATGDQLDGVVVRGAIDSLDIAYLKKLTRDKNLVRIDLSQARISRIGNSAFSSCSKLYEVKLPTSGLREIGDKAFQWCYSLKKVIIPSSVTKRGVDIFDRCTSINFNI